MPLTKPKIFQVTPGTECEKPFSDGLPRQTSGAVVYVWDMLETPFVKIGSTSNIRSRFVSLQSYSPFEIICAFYACPKVGRCYVEAERDVHAALDNYRVRGEWFRLSVDAAISAVREAVR